MKKHIQILAVLSLISIIGLGAEILFFPSIGRQFEYTKDTAYTQLTMIEDTNGSLSSFYSHYIEVHDDGEFNITLPAWTDAVNISLNSTAYEVSAEIMVQTDFLGVRESLLNLTWGANLNMIHENGSATYELPLRRYLLSAGIAYSTKQSAILKLDTTSIEKYNLSWVGISFESMFHADCNSSYMIHYGILLDVYVTYKRAFAHDISFFTLISLGVGIFSAGMLVAEVLHLNPDDQLETTYYH